MPEENSSSPGIDGVVAWCDAVYAGANALAEPVERVALVMWA
jgi:hypothetical protein